ncbi:MAG TPA: hypothetical protein VJM12_10680 [Pyrinomonadaceae bacterium]|nr:hypothetical protein [Pyrinomonadaceae bacterium]
MSTTEAETNDLNSGPTRRRVMIYAAVLLAVFLVGLVPMWLIARGRGAERDVAQRNLRLCRLENDLASAVINARRGEYERARLAASSFFTSLLEQVDQIGRPSDLTAAQSESLRPLLNQRDDLITLLARSDPAAADRLTELYISFQTAMVGRA